MVYSSQEGMWGLTESDYKPLNNEGIYWQTESLRGWKVWQELSTILQLMFLFVPYNIVTSKVAGMAMESNKKQTNMSFTFSKRNKEHFVTLRQLEISFAPCSLSEVISFLKYEQNIGEEG